jgi:hypothetical protein
MLAKETRIPQSKLTKTQRHLLKESKLDFIGEAYWDNFDEDKGTYGSFEFFLNEHRTVQSLVKKGLFKIIEPVHEYSDRFEAAPTQLLINHMRCGVWPFLEEK